MIPYFPIYDVSGATNDRPEALGTKEKFWLVSSGGMNLPMGAYLFKIGRPNTGENWSEKAACEILRYAGVPCASYEFATHDGDAGVISRQFVSVNGRFLPANLLLESAVKDYDGRKRFRQRRYQLSTSLNLFRLRPIAPPRGTPEKFSHLSAAEMLVGYIVFDVLIGNTDRHHENWGVVIDYTDRYSPVASLAPSFDHASSLGRNESDEARTRRLTTKDTRDTVEAYCRRARSAFYGHGSTGQTLQQEGLLQELIRHSPKATRYWATIFSSIPQQVYEDIFGRIDPKLISSAAAQFAIRMLGTNAALIKRFT